MVAGALGGCRPPAEVVKRLTGALRYLEALRPPTIVAPKRQELNRYALYVPRNNRDLILRNRMRGKKGDDASFSKLNTKKVVCQQLLDEPATVRFAWRADDVDEAVLQELARRVTALGGGDDMVVCDAEVMDDADPRLAEDERWVATGPGDPNARRSSAVTVGALDELERRHAAKVAGIGRPPRRASGVESATAWTTATAGRTRRSGCNGSAATRWWRSRRPTP